MVFKNIPFKYNRHCKEILEWNTNYRIINSNMRAKIVSLLFLKFK